MAQRIGGLVRRLRVDRRLPPTVTEVFVETARVKRVAGTQRMMAKGRPAVGASEAGTQVLRGARRLSARRALDRSIDELGTDTSSAVSGALSSAGLDPFLTARRDDGLEFGVALEHRVGAAEALGRALVGSWYVAYEDGRSDGIVPIASLVSDRRAMRAREWNVFEAFSWGRRVAGETAGCRVTFWAAGTSGQIEKIGTRGQSRFLAESATTTEVIRGVEYPGRTAFPVGANLEYFDEPVDVVYTWVDGSDPAWHDDFVRWRDLDGRETEHTAFDPARYTSRDELRYSLRSVWAYCGWIRQIYVVTCGQVPDWLVEDDRIRIVRHGEILPPDALPTFNSHAIEAALHRIEGLSEHFIYFNDDVCLARPVRPELFFTSNGLAKVFQGDALVPGAEAEDAIAVDTAALRGRELLRERFGRVASAKPYHVAFPLRRSVMERVEQEFSDIVEQTKRSRFRAASDLSIAASFAQHFSIGTGDGVFGDIAAAYAHVESGRLSFVLDRVELSDDLDVFCLNETHHSRGDHHARETKIAEFFERTFPIRAPWERNNGSEP